MKFTDLIPEPVKAAPPVGVGGLTFLGIYLDQWVMLVTLVYTLFLIIDKFPTVASRLGEGLRWLKKKARKHE